MMVAGYVIVGASAGFAALTISLVLGASLFLALGLYVLAGFTAIATLAAVALLNRNLRRQVEGNGFTDHADEADPPLLQVMPASAPTPLGGRTMSILAVDDDPFILELIPMIAAKIGFSEVTQAASGEQALTLLRDRSKRFDCLLLDINMPGLDGIELCRLVRQNPRYRATPIVMLTAMRELKFLGEAFQAGATDYATKPFDIEELGTRLRTAQEMVRAMEEPAGLAGDGHQEAAYAPAKGFQKLENMALVGPKSLVSQAILAKYLTELPRNEVGHVGVFAVCVNQVLSGQHRFSKHEIVWLLETLATAADTSFGIGHNLMAFNENSMLLIAMNSTDAQKKSDFETDIAHRIKRKAAKYGTGAFASISISVAGPVHLQGSKADRADLAIDRAIALAEARMHELRSRPIAGLSKHYPQ